jgi:hypothetical protein
MRCSPDGVFVIVKVFVPVSVVVCIGGDLRGTQDFGRSHIDERLGRFTVDRETHQARSAFAETYPNRENVGWPMSRF